MVIRPTSIPLTPQASLEGQFIVICGTTDLAIPAPTTIIVNPGFSISGSTAVIHGTTKAVLSSGTSVPVSGPPQQSNFAQVTGAAAKHRARIWWIRCVGLTVLVVVG